MDETPPGDDTLTKIRAWLQLRLHDFRRDVQAGMAELEVEGHHLADLEELASDVHAEGVVFEQFRSSSESIEAIERAIERLDAGVYHLCDECDRPIGEERLEAIPYATLCIECKRRAESASP